jgi:hypothetical protein
MCHCDDQHDIRVDLVHDLIRKALKKQAVRSMMMMGPRFGHPLDLVEDSTQLGLVCRSNSLVSLQVPLGAVTASWIAAGRTSSRLATDRADLSKSLGGRHCRHVAALVSVDAVPDLGTPRGFAIGFELGVVKTGKQFARESSPNVDRKA